MLVLTVFIKLVNLSVLLVAVNVELVMALLLIVQIVLMEFWLIMEFA